MAEELKVWLHGFDGRMGQEIQTAIAADPSIRLSGGHNKSQMVWQESLADLDSGKVKDSLAGMTDVLIDFSLPAGTGELLTLLEQIKTPPALLICTTGLDETAIARAKALAKVTPVLIAPNTSVGVLATAKVAAELAAQFKPKGFDIEIVESHHRGKKDTPSGTALYFAQRIKDNLPQSVITPNRSGQRAEDEIGVHGIRGGRVYGEHTIKLMGDHEEIEITHRALDRQLFALGALDLARWIVKQSAGFHNVADFSEKLRTVAQRTT